LAETAADVSVCAGLAVISLAGNLAFLAFLGLGHDRREQEMTG
jgi:hypothetical protein